MVPELDPPRIQIQRIVSSKAFKTSEVHRNLLNYLADKSLAGEAQNLKEYTVGLDVFGKPSSYDPRTESVVRMHVGRLRQKLAEYYRTEGVDDPIIVDLPKGGFALTFDARPVPEPAGGMPLPASAQPQRRGFSPRELALAGLLVVAIGTAGFFALRLSNVRQAENAAPAPGPWTPQLQELWAPLLSSDRPLMVTLATGAVSNAASSGTANGTLPTGSVTGVGTANAAFLLGQFLGQRKHNVFPIRSDVLSMGEIAMGDVIFVGPTVGKPQIQAIPPVDVAFQLTPEGVKNVRPDAGESAFMADLPKVVQNGQEIEESHALISNLPGLYGNGSILYFEGNQIASVMGAVQSMTDPDLASQLVARLKQHGGTLPRYYQVVLKIKAMDETPVDISYVAHRALTISKGLKTGQNPGQ